jgi:hypothetical protein
VSHLGLDLIRKRLDVCVLNEADAKLAVTQAPPDLAGLRHLAKEVAALGGMRKSALAVRIDSRRGGIER